MALKTKPSHKVSTKPQTTTEKQKPKKKKQRTRKLEQHGIPHGDDAGFLLVLVLPLA
jgi:hypothetical protein